MLDTEAGNNYLHTPPQTLLLFYLFRDHFLHILTRIIPGTIRDFSLLGGISSSIFHHVPEADRAAGLTWRSFPQVPIQDFFADYIHNYTTLEWMPVQRDARGGGGGDIFSQKQSGAASKDPEVRTSHSFRISSRLQSNPQG